MLDLSQTGCDAGFNHQGAARGAELELHPGSISGTDPVLVLVLGPQQSCYLGVLNGGSWPPEELISNRPGPPL